MTDRDRRAGAAVPARHHRCRLQWLVEVKLDRVAGLDQARGAGAVVGVDVRRCRRGVVGRRPRSYDRARRVAGGVGGDGLEVEQHQLNQ